MKRLSFTVFAILNVLIAMVFAFGQGESSQEKAIQSDDSDWWSELNPKYQAPDLQIQTRAIPASNLYVMGRTILATDSDDWLVPKIGRSKPIFRGDASTARVQHCYKSESPENIYLITESGEVELGFYFLKTDKKWNGEEFCSASSLVSAKLSTRGGLKLGMSSQDVKKMLGKPSFETPDTLIYASEVTIRTDSKGLQQFLQQNATYSENDVVRDFPEKYGLTIFITARFFEGHLSYLHVCKSEID